MHLKHIIATGVVFMAFLWLKATGVGFAASADYVALIMLDGFRRDYLAMYDLPNLKALVSTGTWVAEAKGVFPSCTTPNQAAFITGAYPITSGVANNRYYDKNTDSIVESPRIEVGTSVVDIFRAVGKTTAVVNHFHVLGRADYNAGPNASPQACADIVKAHKPSLLVYYYPHTDTIGHKYGPYSAEMRAETTRADAAVGTIVTAYREAGILKKTLFIIASDHSMSSNDAPAIPVRPSESLRQAGFTVHEANTLDGIPADADVIYLQIGSTFIYLRDKRPSTTPVTANTPVTVTATMTTTATATDVDVIMPREERYVKLIDVLKGLPDVDVFDRAALRALNTDPDKLGDVVVSPKPGLLSVAGSGRGGLHGRPEEAPILLIWSGAGVKRQTVVKDGSIVDIVPTALTLAGITAPKTGIDGAILTSVMLP